MNEWGEEKREMGGRGGEGGGLVERRLADMKKKKFIWWKIRMDVPAHFSLLHCHFFNWSSKRILNMIF